MIKLKEGQKVIGEDGNTYLIEKGDLIESTLNEGSISERDARTALWDLANSFDDLTFVRARENLIYLFNDYLKRGDIIFSDINTEKNFTKAVEKLYSK
jgi:hypothetical protein